MSAPTPVQGTQTVYLEGGATLHDHANGLARLMFEGYDPNLVPCYRVEVGKMTCLLPSGRNITVKTDCSGVISVLLVTVQTVEGPKTFNFPLMSSLHQKSV